MDRDELAARIRETGFSCTKCGTCCRVSPGDGNLVMVYPNEIRDLELATGRKGEEFTDPYPEAVPAPGGGRIMFERCLKRDPRGCIFLSGEGCTAYEARPWICRTFPFAFDGRTLLVSPCPGIGEKLTREDAFVMADMLIARQCAEAREERRVREILSLHPLPAGKDVLVDGTGVRVL